jgi:D-glycero-D-manno-heptose 1,7-bisphosphate phosphatase
MTPGLAERRLQPRDGASGCWYELAPGHCDLAGCPALFLDRDGVIVVDTQYLGRPEDLHMLAGAADAIARCNERRIPVVLVSNQSGIARGLYDWNGFAAVQDALAAALEQKGARLDAVFACAHHADGQPPFNIADHPWRKPNPGMIVDAAERMALDLAHSWIAGDRASDLAAGRAAGLAGGILISSRDDAGERAATLQLRNGAFAIETASSLADAVALLLSPGRSALTSSSAI